MLEPINQRVAGIDIHKKIAVITVLLEQANGEVEVCTREFATDPGSLVQATQWLASCAVELCIIESTGVYWKALHRQLEMAGLRVQVVNARHAKNLPGRKTDVQDSQWLATLGRFGLLKGSFIPDKDLQEIRLLTRYRKKLVGMLSGEKNRLHKILTDAGIQLGNVVSDINGVSARAIVAGIAKGATMEQMLASLKGTLRKKRKAIHAVLSVSLSMRHRFLLEQIQHHIEGLEGRLSRLDQEIIKAMTPYKKQWQALQTIPGVDRIGAAMLIAEIGINMEAFGSMEQFCSWSGMCPGNNESAGKKKSAKRRKGSPMLRQLLCEMANAAIKTKSQFKDKYQTLVIRRGHKRSVVAIGHKMQRVIYSVLKDGHAYYDPGIDYKAVVIHRNAPRWLKALKEFGYIRA